jgi:MFS family permease
VLIVGFTLVPVGQIAAGLLSQTVGRRRLMLWWSAIAAVFGSSLFAVLQFARLDFISVIVFSTLLLVLVVSVWGLATTYINERFRTAVRASGFGLGYSLAVVLPAFYAFYQDWLGNLMPERATVILLLVLACGFTAVGAWMGGPETKDVDFFDEEAN